MSLILFIVYILSYRNYVVAKQKQISGIYKHCRTAPYVCRITPKNIGLSGMTALCKSKYRNVKVPFSKPQSPLLLQSLGRLTF